MSGVGNSSAVASPAVIDVVDGTLVCF